MKRNHKMFSKLIVVSAWGALNTLACEPTYAQNKPFLHLTFHETQGMTAYNTGSGGSKWNAQTNSKTVEWCPGLLNGAAKFLKNEYFKLPEGIMEGITDFTLSISPRIKAFLQAFI